MRESLVQPLVCAECHHVDRDGDERGWQAFLIGPNEDGFGKPETVVVYCPECASEEFGGA